MPVSSTSAPEPDALKDRIFSALSAKAELPASSILISGILAGVYIGFGGLFAIIALSNGDAMPYGMGRVVAGLVFATGLILVIVAGAELFTGNTMMAGPALAGEVAPLQAVRALAIAYGANFLGSLILAGIVFMSAVHEAGAGAVGRSAIDMGETKTGNPVLATFASGILANMLVCLAVWLAYAGDSVTDKLAGLVLPIAAFVAAGLEHSVANMFLLPYALMVQASSGDPSGTMSLAGIIGNLVPATIGNIIGGSSIALAYGRLYPATPKS